MQQCHGVVVGAKRWAAFQCAIERGAQREHIRGEVRFICRERLQEPDRPACRGSCRCWSGSHRPVPVSNPEVADQCRHRPRRSRCCLASRHGGRCRPRGRLPAPTRLPHRPLRLRPVAVARPVKYGGQGDRGNELHDQPQLAVLLDRVEHRHRVRMLKSCRSRASRIARWLASSASLVEAPDCR